MDLNIFYKTLKKRLAERIPQNSCSSLGDFRGVSRVSNDVFLGRWILFYELFSFTFVQFVVPLLVLIFKLNEIDWEVNEILF